MSLSERIREQRLNAGLSQEKVAELVGVSRQAVTKWESGQSAPSTENLLKLAEIFGTGLDLLAATDEINENQLSMEEQIAAALKQEKERRAQERRRDICIAIGIVLAYLLIYMAGRVICMGLPWITGESLHWWLTTTSPFELSYLYGWLLNENLFWWAMVISAIPAAFGKYKFSVSTLVGFLSGLLLGEWCGKNPAGAPRGLTHYGWEIWLLMYLFSAAMGIILEKLSKKNFTWRSKKFLVWCGAYVVGIIVIILLVRVSMWHP